VGNIMSKSKKRKAPPLNQLLLESVSDSETESLMDIEKEREALLRQKTLKKSRIAALEKEIKKLEEKAKELDEARNAILEEVTSRVKLKIARAKDMT
jgi:septal ring factor EnvC (AmiA/AmiB activator)